MRRLAIESREVAETGFEQPSLNCARYPRRLWVLDGTEM
jgi:hypothetical protein